MAGEERFIPPDVQPKPFWKRVLAPLVVVAMVGGLYWAWQTGELLKAFEWLMGQDILVLTIIAVVALIALALGLSGG
ncbi:MAG TPA: hypothetical protein ENN60_02260 [archaeon]|nr:hypothetical protein [archaeon]